MTNEPLFLDVAKIAATLVGFVGVVVALRHPRNEGWTRAEVNGTKLMLEHGFAAILLGVSPSVLGQHFPKEAEVWQCCSAVLAVFFAYELLINSVRIRYALAADSPPRAFFALLATFFPPTAIMLYLQFKNAVTWHGSLVLAVGAVWLLVACCVQFTQFILRVKPSAA